MALFEGLLGGGGGDPLDLYGDLFTPQQKAALRDRQMTDTLLRLSAGFAKAGQASRLPTGGLLGAIGEAAGGLAGGGDEAVNQQLKAMQIAEQVRASRQQRGFATQVATIAQQLLAQEKGLGLAPGTLVRPYLASTGGSTAPAAPGAPAGGPPASNAPAPPAGPQPSTGLVPPEGLPGGATSGAGAEWLPILPAGAAPATAMPPPIYPLGDPNIPLPRAPGRTGGLLSPAGQGLEQPPGPGVLPQLAAMYGGGGGSGAPFGQETPGAAAGDGLPDLSNIKIEQLSGEAAPAGGREGRVAFWTAQGAPQHVAEGIADRVKAESGFRSDAMGDQGTSGGLYQHHADRLSRLKSFAAQQGTSWTDPNVQDRFAATEVKGGDAIAAKGWPAILAAPDRQTAATLWDKYFERSKYGPGAGGGFSGRVEQLGGDAVPAGAAPAGKIPGLNISPQGLAALNMLSKLGGLGSPFESLLETYYKSPSYLSEKTTAETKARTDIEDPLNQRMKVLEMALDMRKNGILYNPQTGEIKADPEWDKIHGRRAEDTKILELDYAKRLKTFEEQQKIAEEIRKDQKEIAPQPIYRGGVIVEQPMTREAAVARLKDQSMRPGEYRDGDIVAKPIGNLSPDHQYKMSSTGGLTVEPIAGTPGAEKAAAAAKAKDISDRQLLVSRDIVVQDADRLENLIKTSPVPVTGMMGSLLSNMPGTPQSNAKALIDGLRARASIDAINRARAATGSTGMGQITMGEHALLANALANLEQSQGEAQLLFNLRRFKQEYIDAVHGPGAHSSLLPDTPVVKTPSSAPAGTAATSPADATRLRSEAADAIKAGKSRSAVIKRLQDMGVDAGGL